MPLQTKKPLTPEQKAFISGAKYGDNTTFEDSTNVGDGIATQAKEAITATQAKEAITATQAKEAITATQAIRLSNGYINKKGETKSNLRLLLTDSQIKELKRRALDRGISVSEMVAQDLGV